MSDIKAKILIVTGVSAGAGKDTLVKMFLERHPDWLQPPSTTTRPKREGEQDGKDYRFVDSGQFKQWQAEGKFLESDFHAGHWYGTLKEPVRQALDSGANVILRVDVNGTLSIKKQFPQAIDVFVKPEDIHLLEERLRIRNTETEEQIKDRLTLAQKELGYEKHFSHVIINPTGHPEIALAELEKLAI